MLCLLEKIKRWFYFRAENHMVTQSCATTIELNLFLFVFKVVKGLFFIILCLKDPMVTVIIIHAQ